MFWCCNESKQKAPDTGSGSIIVQVKDDYLKHWVSAYTVKPKFCIIVHRNFNQPAFLQPSPFHIYAHARTHTHTHTHTHSHAHAHTHHARTTCMTIFPSPPPLASLHFFLGPRRHALPGTHLRPAPCQLGNPHSSFSAQAP